MGAAKENVSIQRRKERRRRARGRLADREREIVHNQSLATKRNVPRRDSACREGPVVLAHVARERELRRVCAAKRHGGECLNGKPGGHGLDDELGVVEHHAAAEMQVRDLHKEGVVVVVEIGGSDNLAQGVGLGAEPGLDGAQVGLVEQRDHCDKGETFSELEMGAAGRRGNLEGMVEINGAVSGGEDEHKIGEIDLGEVVWDVGEHVDRKGLVRVGREHESRLGRVVGIGEREVDLRAQEHGLLCADRESGLDVAHNLGLGLLVHNVDLCVLEHTVADLPGGVHGRIDGECGARDDGRARELEGLLGQTHFDIDIVQAELGLVRVDANHAVLDGDGLAKLEVRDCGTERVAVARGLVRAHPAGDLDGCWDRVRIDGDAAQGVVLGQSAEGELGIDVDDRLDIDAHAGLRNDPGALVVAEHKSSAHERDGAAPRQIAAGLRECRKCKLGLVAVADNDGGIEGKVGVLRELESTGNVARVDAVLGGAGLCVCDFGSSDKKLRRTEGLPLLAGHLAVDGDELGAKGARDREGKRIVAREIDDGIRTELVVRLVVRADENGAVGEHHALAEMEVSRAVAREIHAAAGLGERECHVDIDDKVRECELAVEGAAVAGVLGGVLLELEHNVVEHHLGVGDRDCPCVGGVALHLPVGARDGARDLKGKHIGALRDRDAGGCRKRKLRSDALELQRGIVEHNSTAAERDVVERRGDLVAVMRDGSGDEHLGRGR
eukprot:comp22464_c0_seq1/m.55407 comp22464_c0_seq1/g.55407  ORF comp22464_c0_seq1/g.55407 comp22464_c0_seq1/m.55407 type:complete len:726 (+) comp22464_c0_seq1:2570-4747(+)